MSSGDIPNVGNAANFLWGETQTRPDETKQNSNKSLQKIVNLKEISKNYFKTIQGSSGLVEC